MNYPDLDPVAFQIGPLALRWYGLMYLVGFALAAFLGMRRARRQPETWTSDDVLDLVFWGVGGVVVGGRLGYVAFYGLERFLADPLSLVRVWEGGMSFHGGLLGVLAAMALYARKTGRAWLQVTDFAAPLVPLGLGMGRLGNFINAELPGRVTELAVGVRFPCASVLDLSVLCFGDHESVARHVSSLYQAFAEGLALFALVWIFAAKPRATGTVSGVFLLGYGLMRVVTEWFRQPDPDKGFIAFGWLTIGQALSVPMVLFGVALLVAPAFRDRLAKFPAGSARSARDEQH